MTATVVAVTRGRGESVHADCSCGWFASFSSRTIEGHSLARGAADGHLWAHRHGEGWFHPMNGWTVNPAPCSCHYTTPAGTRVEVALMTACRICGGDTVPPTPGRPEEEDHYCESCGTTTAADRLV